MTRADDRLRAWPRLGDVPIDPAALDGRGTVLSEILTRYGAAAAVGREESAHSRWWVVGVTESAVRMVAPVRGSWDECRVGVLALDVDPPDWRVEPAPVRLRRSLDESMRGLSLRWPDVLRTIGVDLDSVPIDVLNTTEQLWHPDGDPFRVAGVLVPEGSPVGATDPVHAVGHGAPPLGPGEYARRLVDLWATDWGSLRPGRHRVDAVLVDGGLRPTVPLIVELTEREIDRRRSAVRPAAPPLANDGRRTIRLFPEWGVDHPLWEHSTSRRETGYLMTPEEYGLTVPLADALRRWNDRWQDAPGREAADVDPEHDVAWQREGTDLVARLRAEVAAFADVSYEAPAVPPGRVAVVD